MKIIIYLMIVTFLSLFVSCEESGQKVNNVNYPSKTDNYNVRFLFEVDGIRVYKFNYGNSEVFFTNTNGETEHNQSYTIGGKIYTNKKIKCICNKKGDK